MKVRLCSSCGYSNPEGSWYCQNEGCGQVLSIDTITEIDGDIGDVRRPESSKKLKTDSLTHASHEASNLELVGIDARPPTTEVLPSGQSHLAYRLGGIVLFVNLFMFLISTAISGSSLISTNLLPILIDGSLAIGLFQLRQGARTWVLVRAILGAVLWPILLFTQHDPLDAGILTVIQLSLCAALILLLTGKSKTWRLVAAVAIFAILGVLPTLMLLALGLLASALGQ